MKTLNTINELIKKAESENERRKIHSRQTDRN